MDKEIYNSIFQEEIHDLIALKRALGFSYESEAGSLRRIDTFLCENNLSEKRISKELCDLWCRKRTYETVTNQASRISVMRVFCKYLNDIGIPAYIPPKRITRKRSRYDAHIDTEEGSPQGNLCRARHKPPYDEIDVMPRYVQYS